MNLFDPFNVVRLSGLGVMRNVTIALPLDLVRAMLPVGLELGSQTMTDAEHHPVILGFHDMIDEKLSIPSLMPRLSYREHSFGIPYCYVTSGEITPATPGPYFYMPRLLVDDRLAALGGTMFWGFNKDLSVISSDQTHFTCTDAHNARSVSLNYELTGTAQAIEQYPEFAEQREAISQPLISMMPIRIGTTFVVAAFAKRWDVATLAPMRASVDIATEYVRGMSPGRYPASDEFPTIEASVLGGYELRAPFQVSSPRRPEPPARYR